jgi:cobalt-zinc-cadmium efflux system membrane fusion protein
LLFVGAIALLGCGDRSATPSATPAASASSAAPAGSGHTVSVAPDLVTSGRIRTVVVARREATGTLRFPADVVASAESAAEAGSLVAGRIAGFEVREGDRVKRGQVLAWIDAPEAARALADVLRARARTEAGTRKVERLEGLVAAEAGTRLALDEARLELALARADLGAARTLSASLGIGEPAALPTTAGALPARVPIRSPVAGVVVERLASLGSHVSPETSVFHLVGEGGVVVEARVPEIAAARLSQQSVASLVPRSGPRCSARLLAVLPQVDPATRTRRARLLPDASCIDLVPGGQTEVELALPPAGPKSSGETVIAVPPEALVEARGASLAFVRRGGVGTFEMRPVEPGGLLGELRIIRAGLAVGDEVVVDGAVLLKGELLRAELGGGE